MTYYPRDLSNFYDDPIVYTHYNGTAADITNDDNIAIRFGDEWRIITNVRGVKTIKENARDYVIFIGNRVLDVITNEQREEVFMIRTSSPVRIISTTD